MANLIGNSLSGRGAQGHLSILIYHRVLPSIDPMRSDEVDVDTFRLHMATVSKYFHVLPLVEAIERLRGGALPGRALCITFDDGYADNRYLALPVLQEFGLQATFFIATDYLDGGIMWNDAVIEALRQTSGTVLDLHQFGLGKHSLTDVQSRRDVAYHLIKKFKYLNFRERQERMHQVVEACSAVLPRDLMMSTKDVQALHSDGMMIGAHTNKHPILARLERLAAREEIAVGKERLESIVGEPVKLFAYPNGTPGTDYTKEHVHIVKDLGFLGAVSTTSGVAGTNSDLFQLPRFTPWEKSKGRFLLRMWQNLVQGAPTAMV
jgi:peptidoglycan/xylan/chitin deacetylase (PgdA/CDA1 family)